VAASSEAVGAARAHAGSREQSGGGAEAELDAQAEDERNLKSHPLFGDFGETATATGELDKYVKARRQLHGDFSVGDVDTMAPDALLRLIERHGMAHDDCRGVGALRSRARQCFEEDDDDDPFLPEALLRNTSSASPGASPKHAPALPQNRAETMAKSADTRRLSASFVASSPMLRAVSLSIGRTVSGSSSLGSGGRFAASSIGRTASGSSAPGKTLERASSSSSARGGRPSS
jgi:hypothetical protein